MIVSWVQVRQVLPCKNLSRNFIGMEKDAEYFEIAKHRNENHIVQLSLIT